MFCIDQRFGSGREYARLKSFTDEATLAVAAVRIKSIANHRFPVTDDVGDHCYYRAGHLRKVDVGVGDGRGEWDGFFADFCDSHSCFNGR